MLYKDNLTITVENCSFVSSGDHNKMSSNIKPGGKYVELSYQCEICNGVSVKDMFYCEECMQYMCTSCGTLHDKFRLLANHTKTTCTSAKVSKANKALPNQRSPDNDPESKPYNYAYNETTSKMNVLMSSKNSTDSKVQSGYVNVTDGYITPTTGRDRKEVSSARDRSPRQTQRLIDQSTRQTQWARDRCTRQKQW